MRPEPGTKYIAGESDSGELTVDDLGGAGLANVASRPVPAHRKFNNLRTLQTQFCSTSLEKIGTRSVVIEIPVKSWERLRQRVDGRPGIDRVDFLVPDAISAADFYSLQVSFSTRRSSTIAVFVIPDSAR